MIFEFPEQLAAVLALLRAGRYRSARPDVKRAAQVMKPERLSVLRVTRTASRLR